MKRPFGGVLAEGSEGKEEVLLADCDLSEIERTRQGWPFLRDRRVDAYGPLTKRFLDESGAPAPEAKGADGG